VRIKKIAMSGGGSIEDTTTRYAETDHLRVLWPQAQSTPWVFGGFQIQI
jgi:hypothetical protein